MARTAPAPTASRPPNPALRQFRVCLKVQRPNADKAFWPRIGTAWENELGAVMVVTDGMAPLGGEVLLFRDEPREREPGGDDA